jgi:hypothetical protein
MHGSSSAFQVARPPGMPVPCSCNAGARQHMSDSSAERAAMPLSSAKQLGPRPGRCGAASTPCLPARTPATRAAVASTAACLHPSPADPQPPTWSGGGVPKHAGTRDSPTTWPPRARRDTCSGSPRSAPCAFVPRGTSANACARPLLQSWRSAGTFGNGEARKRGLRILGLYHETRRKSG